MSSADGQQLLIERARAGDRPALERLLLEYSPQLNAHIASRLPVSLRRTHAVEDVSQQALTRAFLKIGHLRNTSPQAFAVWLKAVGERTLMELIRSQRCQKRGGKLRCLEPHPQESLLDILDYLPDEVATASQRLAREEALAALRVSLKGLPVDQRRAVELHLLQRMSLEETARVMGRSPSAIRGLVQRGKQKLAEAMGRASAWLSTT